MSDSSVRVEIVEDLGHINVRGEPASPSFVKAVRESVGIALPVTANTSAVGEHAVHWLGPDEWLIVSPGESAAALCDELAGKLRGEHAAVNDVSGGHVVLRLSGTKAREILSKGCTLDLHPAAFGENDCAQTGLAKAGVLLACNDAGIDIIVRRSFSDYLLQWLLGAGADCGIEFT